MNVLTKKRPRYARDFSHARPCAYCGASFRPHKANENRGGGLYCGIKCFHKTRSASLTRPPEQRFWEKVHKTELCWNWTGAVSSTGHGSFGNRVDGVAKQISAHRFSWQLVNGSVPDGLLVCHKCENPRCVRPDHLFLGTNKQNSHDSWDKRRVADMIFSEVWPRFDKQELQSLDAKSLMRKMASILTELSK